MTNPVWQPGPPKVAGWFWVEYKSDTLGIVKTIAQFRMYEKVYCVLFPTNRILRHAGPVEIPEPVEPGGGEDARRN